MPYIKPDDPDFEAKKRKWRYTVDYYNKKYNLGDYDVKKAAKNAILPQTAVKTRNFDQKDAELATSAALKDYIEDKKTPVSTADPNKAFRALKARKRKNSGLFDWIEIDGGVK